MCDRMTVKTILSFLLMLCLLATPGTVVKAASTPAPGASAEAATEQETGEVETPKPFLWAAVQAGGETPRSRREYTEAQQVERLLTLLPKASDSIQAGTHTAGRVPLEVEIHRGEGVERYFYYPQGYVTRRAADGSEAWFSATTSHWTLLRTLTDWDPGALEKKIEYKGETITEVYGLNYGNRSYHRVTDTGKIEHLVALLEKYKPNEEATFGNVGFLILTDQDRHALYFDPDTAQELINFASDCVRASYPLIQWLVYMDPQNIESITCTAPVGKDSLAGGDALRAKLTAKDTEGIRYLSSYLKGMIVEQDTAVKWEKLPESGSALATIDIVFSTGTTYHITTDRKSLTISCPQMEEYIVYPCYSSRLQGLYDLIGMMPGAKVTPLT